MGQFLISNMVIWSNNRRQGLAITCTNLCKVRRNMSQCPSEDITPSCHASFFRRLLYLFLSTDGLVSLRVVTDMYNRRITIYVWCVEQVSLCSNNFWSRQSCCHNIGEKRKFTCVQHKVSVLLGLTTTVMSPPDQIQGQTNTNYKYKYNEYNARSVYCWRKELTTTVMSPRDLFAGLVLRLLLPSRQT